MGDKKSFKERVKDTVEKYSVEYKKYYVDYEYLICSKAFHNNRYYIISSHEDNYLHLTGLHTSLSAMEFFDKCYSGTLDESDFDFIKTNLSESEVKGSVRRKINVLPSVMNLFSVDALIEEDFIKNRIQCSLAVGNIKATLGFNLVGKAKPMTLLKGNELDDSKAKKLDLVLRKKVGEEKFGEIVIGNEDSLKLYKEIIKNEVNESIYNDIM